MQTTTNESAIEKQRDQAKRDAVTNDLVIRTLMSTKDGRRYLWLQLAEMKVFSAVMTFGSNILAVTAFNEGKRSLGIALLSDITRVAPEGYVTMTRENSDFPMENDDG